MHVRSRSHHQGPRIAAVISVSDKLVRSRPVQNRIDPLRGRAFENKIPPIGRPVILFLRESVALQPEVLKGIVYETAAPLIRRPR